MKKTKKILLNTSLITLGIACLMLIAQVFGAPIFETNALLRILLIISTISIATGLSISEITVMERKKILGYIGLALLGISSLFAIIIFASDLLGKWGLFAKLTLIFSITSIIFVRIIAHYTKLGKHNFKLQIITYALYIIFDILITLLICGVSIFDLPGMIQFFVVLCIACAGLFVALSVLGSKKFENDEKPTLKGDMITIPKSEYEALKNENASLKAEIQNLKNSLEINN